MVKIYAANISKKDYTVGAEHIMSRQRLEKYRNISHIHQKRQCAAAGWLLKRALGGEQEHYDPKGKPCLKNGYLSISHSGDWVVVAISQSPVGIDIEEIRDVNSEAVGRRCFSGISFESREDFFEAWVKKESMLKKLGLGIGHKGEDVAKHNFLMLDNFGGYAAALCTDEREYEIEII